MNSLMYFRYYQIENVESNKMEVRINREQTRKEWSPQLLKITLLTFLVKTPKPLSILVLVVLK